jgi:hypothetical protein
VSPTQTFSLCRNNTTILLTRFSTASHQCQFVERYDSNAKWSHLILMAGIISAEARKCAPPDADLNEFIYLCAGNSQSPDPPGKTDGSVTEKLYK